MSRRIFKQSFPINIFLFTGLLILTTVRADLKGQPDVKRSPVNSEKTESVPILCDCEFFVQSWKISHMIRLPMGIQPVRANSTTQTSNSEMCFLLCQKQLPPLPEDEKEVKWARIFKDACRKLLANEYTYWHGGIRSMTTAQNIDHTGNDSVRGYLQAYARSSHTRIWVPMGIQYRKLFSCRLTSQRRSLMERQKLLKKQSSINSVDAQSIADDAGVTQAPTGDVTTTPKPDSPLRIFLKKSGRFNPYFESLVGVLDIGGWRELLNLFKLGFYVDRYQQLTNRYAEEKDFGYCFFDHLTYNIFNNRFSQKKRASKQAMRKEEQTNQQPAPDVKNVTMSLFQSLSIFYLRNFLGDPTNNPDILAGMIEQDIRSVFLSKFGVDPGVPASGKLDHLLTFSSKNPEFSDNETGMTPPESKNKLVPIEPKRSSTFLEPITLITGRSFFDFGNSVVASFQRASDATHGLYCVNQYMVNKMWTILRQKMRKMLRAIPISE